MREELERQLIEEFPDLFVDKDKPPTESLMCFGCECDDGWFDILRTMCACIANHLKYGPQPREFPYRFSQIKEKFAGLRVYDYGADEYIDGVTAMAEAMSYKTCEHCGQPGRTMCTSGGYWLKTLCPTHAKEFNYRALSETE